MVKNKPAKLDEYITRKFLIYIVHTEHAVQYINVNKFTYTVNIRVDITYTEGKKNVVGDESRYVSMVSLFKGAVSRDFRTLFFFINRTHLGP